MLGSHSKSKEKVILVFRLSAAAILLVVGAYVWNFWWVPISGDPGHWGTFGDYVGGLLNPVFAFANLIVLIYISFWVAENDRQREIRDVRHQKMVALYSIRQDAVLRLSAVLDKVHLVSLGSFNSDVKIEMGKVGIELGVFLSNHHHIFPALTKYNQKPIIDCVERIGDLIQAYFSAVLNVQIGQQLVEDRADEEKSAMLEEFKTWNKLRSELTGLLIGYIQID